MPDALVINPPSPARPRGLMESDDAEFYECFESYVMALVRLSRAFMPSKAERNWGRGVLLGSANMKSPNSIDPIVSHNIRIAGAAVMKTLTYEFSKSGATFNTLAIGAIHTDLTDVVVFLCSQPTGYLNGETVRLDGGQIEWLF